MFENGAGVSLKHETLVVLATAGMYVALFELNSLLFLSFSFSKGVDWVYLPSGLRLAFILIFGVSGALGIGMASFAISLNFYFLGDYQTAIFTGLISGFSPLLARKFCIDFIELDVNLEKLSPSTLLKVSAIFAIISPVLHQLWFRVRGQTQDFISSTSVMALGDFTGTIIVLYAAKFLINSLQHPGDLNKGT